MTRPKHNNWSKGFIRKHIKDSNNMGKFVAHCLQCDKYLSNTASNRLKMHRNVCKFDMEEDSMSSTDNSQTTEHFANNNEVTQANLMLVLDNQRIQSKDGTDMESNYNLSEEVEIAETEKSINISKMSFEVCTTSTKTSTAEEAVNKQGVQMKSYINCTNSYEYSKINENLISYLITNNLNFETVHSNYFLKFIQYLKPGYKPPTAEMLLNNMLDEFHYNYVTKSIPLDCYGVLLVSAQAHKDLVSMVFNKQGHYFFIKMSKYCERLKQFTFDSIMIVKSKFNQDIHTVICDSEFPLTSIVSDNCIQYWYFECMSLTLKKLTKSIFDSIFLEKIKELHKEIEIQILRKTTSEIKTISDIDINHYNDCYNFLEHCLNNMKNMRQLAVDEPSKVKQNICLILFDNDFEVLLNDVAKVVQYICKINDKIGFEYTLADAVENYFDIAIIIQNDLFKTLIVDNLKGILTPVALTSNYFHPVYQGKKFMHLHEYELLVNDFLVDELTETDMTDFLQYQDKSGIFSKILEKNIKSPQTFWRTIARYHPGLANFCLKICTIPAFTNQNKFQFCQDEHLNSDQQNKLCELYYLLKINESS